MINKNEYLQPMKLRGGLDLHSKSVFWGLLLIFFVFGCSKPLQYKKTQSLTASGKFRFNLKAANKQVIGTSQSYSSASGRDNGIASVQKNAPDAKVVEA